LRPAWWLLPPTPLRRPPPPIVVTFNGDQGDLDPNDGVCDATAATSEDCTLRAAIQEANARTGADEIDFSIPKFLRDPATGVATITPESPLPAITERVTINGYTQPGAHPNTLANGTDAAPKVQLDGTNLPNDDGLELQGSSGSVIRGLVINRFNTGIELDGGTASNRIEGNFIGTDPSGTLDRGNTYGFFQFGAAQNTIGGTTPATRNLISGNTTGIFFANGDANKVLGNLVGTDASGTGALSNDEFGVALTTLSAAAGTTGNRIGNGTAAGSNTVAFNGLAGIAAGGKSVVHNPISRNSIFSNGGLGIDLVSENNGFGVTPNDAGDADVGPNGLQNFPAITAAKSSSTATAITGKLSSTAGRTFTVELYSNPSFTDEGKTFLGKKSVTTDSSGKATFTFKPASRVPVGRAITATATDASGNTSEFSAPTQVAKG
jgi:CSLREA domain-containing protein